MHQLWEQQQGERQPQCTAAPSLNWKSWLYALLSVWAEHIVSPFTFALPHLSLLSIFDFIIVGRDTEKIRQAQEMSDRESCWWPNTLPPPPPGWPTQSRSQDTVFLLPCLPLRISKTGWRKHLTETLDSGLGGWLSQPLLSFSSSCRGQRRNLAPLHSCCHSFFPLSILPLAGL